MTDTYPVTGYLAQYIKQIEFEPGKYWPKVTVTYSNDNKYIFETMVKNYTRPAAISVYTGLIAKDNWSKTAVKKLRTYLNGGFK